MGQTGTLQQPGVYPGSNQANLLNANHQYFLFKNQRPGTGSPNQASVAVQLGRLPWMAYPFGAAIQAQFSGAPGTFNIDVEGAEDDQDAMYVQITSISSVNASNVGRASIGFTYPKFVRVKVTSLTNDVNVTVIITR